MPRENFNKEKFSLIKTPHHHLVILGIYAISRLSCCTHYAKLCQLCVWRGDRKKSWRSSLGEYPESDNDPQHFYFCGVLHSLSQLSLVCGSKQSWHLTDVSEHTLSHLHLRTDTWSHLCGRINRSKTTHELNWGKKTLPRLPTLGKSWPSQGLSLQLYNWYSRKSALIRNHLLSLL